MDEPTAPDRLPDPPNQTLEAREVEWDEGVGAFGTGVAMAPPLDDPEKGLVRARVGVPAPPGPPDRAADGVGDRLLVGRESRAVVQTHRDVGAEVFLDLDGPLG